MGLTKRLKNMFTGDSAQESSATQKFRKFSLGTIDLKNNEFISDIYNEEILTPHEEMRAGYRMMHNDPEVAAAIGTRTDIIMGDKLSVDTDDEKTKEEFEDDILPKLRRPLRNGIRDMSMTGNGYVEVLRGKRTGNPLDFEEMERPHKVYIDFEDGTFEIEKYILKSRGSKSGERYDVRYFGGRRKTIKGKPIPKENIIHLTEGSSVIPKYGRSDFLSSLDAYKIKRELLRSQAVIARQKSIPRHLIQVKDPDNESGIDVPDSTTSPKKKKDIETKLSSMNDYENPVFYNTDISVKDFGYDPKKSENQEVIKELSKEITSSMPNFLTHPEDSNRATAKEEKQLLQLRMRTVRSNIANAVNPVLQEIAENRGLDPNVTLEFGEYDVDTKGEKEERAVKLFEADLITRNEARDMLGMKESDENGFKDNLIETIDDESEDIGSKEQEINTVPPQEVANIASDALDALDNPDYDNDDCGTQVGKERANQLENRESLSKDTIERMTSFFDRHDGNQEVEGDEKWEDCGYVTWQLWGGDAGRDWAESKLDEFED